MRKALITGSLIATAIILIVYFQSCKKDSYDDSTALSYSYKNDALFAPLSTAIVVAENMNKSAIVVKTSDKASVKTAAYQGKRKIKDNLTISDKEKQNPYFYVLNYESGGYAIISADKRLTPIVGYSDNGYFKMDSIPLGLIEWFEATASLVKHLRTSNAQPSAYVKYQWANLQCDQNLLKSEPPTPPTPDDYEVTITVGPLLTTMWAQGSGYNTYCPVLSGGPNGHAYTGCSTTAVAQVMAYWKYPATYNWSGMSSNYGNNAVAVLMGDIFPNTIDSYDTGGSSCKNDYNIRHTFINRFGYRSASLAGWVNGWVENGGYNYQTVVSNLNASQPVILGAYSSYKKILGIKYPTGSGHTWVCDGYRQTTFTFNTYLLFHMNWGWGQYSYNGWYYFNDWSNPNGSYNYFTDMIYNIHP